jgi:hypothetical protein
MAARRLRGMRHTRRKSVSMQLKKLRWVRRRLEETDIDDMIIDGPGDDRDTSDNTALSS